MASFNEAERKRNAIQRANVLLALNACDPMPLGDAALLSYLQANYPADNYSAAGVRRALKYLEGHGLAMIRYGKADDYWNDAGGAWLATITSHGIDYLSGIGQALQGVYRAEE